MLARHHFAPTESARRNLLAEGVAGECIVVTGNTVIDALLDVVAMKPSRAPKLTLRGRRIILITAHRRENFGAPLLEITGAIRDLAGGYPDVDLVYPVHRNPNVDRPVRKELSDVPGVHLIDPLEYKAFADLMAESYLILTDSGGIQEEAPSLGKPVLVLRDETERPEAVEFRVHVERRPRAQTEMVNHSFLPLRLLGVGVVRIAGRERYGLGKPMLARCLRGGCQNHGRVTATRERNVTGSVRERVQEQLLEHGPDGAGDRR